MLTIQCCTNSTVGEELVERNLEIPPFKQEICCGLQHDLFFLDSVSQCVSVCPTYNQMNSRLTVYSEVYSVSTPEKKQL